jgi:ribosomal-protein-alanine N-acetyltransferase
MIRTLFKSDLNQLLEIEKSVHVVPWTEETFKICFHSGHVGWAIELDKKIIGFIIISLTMDECHILNLCVAHEFQHQGWGRQLLEKALIHAKQKGLGIAYLEVRKSNSRAISLYRLMKFHFVGQRKNYYPTEAGNEDALIFALNLRRSSL